MPTHRPSRRGLGWAIFGGVIVVFLIFTVTSNHANPSTNSIKSGAAVKPSDTQPDSAIPIAQLAPPTVPPDTPFTPDPNAPSVRPVQATTFKVVSFNCTYETFGSAGGFGYVQGEVTNTSSQPVRDAEAVGTWLTSDGQFIRSDDALIDFNPILPGQTSPFKTISTYNPAMSRCRLQFKNILGAPISATFPSGSG